MALHMAAELDYVPLPASLIAQVKKTWTTQITVGRHAGVDAASRLASTGQAG